ncbi:hypothetical protein MTR67_045380 [Solanum verrucosum]|uniref:Reverse transcriptase/retrotransposon-derived protein RNase H-like domain-containing protein n=1 Tax=Solanum verrucosum TaxID=315347 RepID=A0AAF0ZWK9_SOLVR|nr:hypothetical protein MTR67_045380 [Solanum verrucosum]
MFSYFCLRLVTRESPGSPLYPADMDSLLASYEDVFCKPQGLPPARELDHAIHLNPGSGPVNVKPYRYPYFQKNIMEQLVANMLTDGIIRPSTSSFSSPILLVQKKDGTWLFSVDYRALNVITIGVRPEDVAKTAFRTHKGHYEFLVMPFGLSTVPSTFQATMNLIFRPLLRRCVLTQIDYLGHVISSKRLAVDLSKISAIQQWPIPTNVKRVWSFLGLAGYYRHFIKNYATIASPLTDLLKKVYFKWGDAAQLAFETLKNKLSCTPVLVLPDFTQEFHVEIDVSGVVIQTPEQQQWLGSWLGLIFILCIALGNLTRLLMCCLDLLKGL